MKQLIDAASLHLSAGTNRHSINVKWWWGLDVDTVQLSENKENPLASQNWGYIDSSQ